MLKQNGILKVRRSTYVEFTYINLFCIDNLFGYPTLKVKIRIPSHIVLLFCTHFLKLHIPEKFKQNVKENNSKTSSLNTAVGIGSM